MTKNNVFVTLKQSEVINFVKAQASLEMECPRRLEIFLFNFRAEIILADRHQISFLLNLTVQFRLFCRYRSKKLYCLARNVGKKCTLIS